MSIRGQRSLSRMLITFCDHGGSSEGMRKYLKDRGGDLKRQIEELGGRFVVEVRRNHHPEIRTCYYGGRHIQRALELDRRHKEPYLHALRWAPSTVKRGLRLDILRHGLSPYYKRQRLADAKRLLSQRLLNSDTENGRTLNILELRDHVTDPEQRVEPSLPLPGGAPEEKVQYSIPQLMEAVGCWDSVNVEVDDEGNDKNNQIKMPPRRLLQGDSRGYWPVWKVWGPSDKLVNARNLRPDQIEQHLWWMTRSAGERSSKWGNNVERHKSLRPTIQGAWTPNTAFELQRAAFKCEEIQSW